jgi:peptidoglycan-N-acetylglucosamine deacetylase
MRIDTSSSLRPLASLSLDADNLWAYQMTHGDPDWERYGSYLDDLVRIVLPALEAQRLTITFFVVGRDADRPENHAAISAMAEAGHEIGNHSFDHRPWLHRYTVEQLHLDLGRTEAAIESITGTRPVGFRGPGYSLSPDVIRVLIDRGYRYDCSTLPTVIGPLARRYYFRSAELTPQQQAERSYLFGSARDGLWPLRPYWWRSGDDRLLEIPVTTLPLTRVPFHLSYVLYLAGSHRAGPVLLRQRAAPVPLRGIEPSILLHPLDFLGADDVDSLRFFPGMAMEGAAKREVVAAASPS